MRTGVPLAFDLSARVKLSVSGADSLRFLNGQVTNDVRKVSADHALHAAVLNAKGRINADVFIANGDDGFLLDADPELSETLLARLDRYVIADDVQIDDVTGDWALFHLLGDEVPEVAGIEKMITSNRFGADGWDLWVHAADAGTVRQSIESRASWLTGDAMEVFRIERGIPRWGRELTEEIIPVEANLETAAIDYAKGCYIGQEVISRMKMSGQTNKRLVGFFSTSGEPLQAGMRLTSMANELGRDAGWITSATHSGRLRAEIALGFLKRGHGAVGDELLARSNLGGPTTVRVTDIPFL